jgi:hypothetical protein
MKKLTAIAAVPLFAGFLMAQDAAPQRETQTETTTTTKSTTWNGTLVDASCRATGTAHRESTETSQPDEKTTKTTKTTTDTTNYECPVTTSTTSFGLMTPDGKYIRFDDPSNTKVIEVVKNNKKWSKNLESREPVKVRVVGNQKGDMVVVESIQ